ncbi:MAG: S9 family peptidase, partial [Gemmatimonadetes bacterium]|nr:S9 family peptidase [Gemmatimonadota bacterium]
MSMPGRRTFPAFLTLVLLVVVQLTPMEAQETEQASAPSAIGLQDILSWKRIVGPTLSKDGQWFAHRLSPGEGNSELVVRSTRDETEHRFPVGERGGPVSFSDDSRWVAFAITPTKEEADGPGGGNGPARNDVGLLDLSSGEMTKFEAVSSFAFAGERGGWIALRKYPASAAAASRGGGNGNGESRPRGVDLLLHNLASGVQLNLGNVSDFRFDDSGRWLALAIDAQGKAGNGIHLRDMETGVIRVLESAEARYSRLVWAEDRAAFLAFKETEDDDYEDPIYAVVGWTDLDRSSGPEMISYDPHIDSSFPEGMTISTNRPLQWSDAGDAILFGVQDVEMKEGAEEEEEGEEAEEEEGEAEERPGRAADEELDDDEKPDLVIWHWQDPRLQAMQQVQETRDKNFSYLAVYWLDSGRFVRLADDEVDSVTPAGSGYWAVGRDDTEYELMGNLDGRRYQDIYAIDMRSGEREMILERARWANTISPDGAHFLYYRDGHYHTYEFATGQHRNITSEVPTSFIDTEDDHNVVDPPVRARGWTEDGGTVLLSDNWDVWGVDVHGQSATNLTVNGKVDQIRYAGPMQFDPDGDPGVDLSEPTYFQTYGEWTKKSGYSLMTNGRPGPEVLVWDDVRYGQILKAEDADTYVISWTTNETYPDYHLTDSRLRNPRRLTNGFPEQADYLWSDGAMLVDYESDKGDRLQGALYLPANYQEGESYPTIVYFYEKVSQNLHGYTFPTAYGFNKSVYTSNGYAVFMPDIVYTIN